MAVATPTPVNAVPAPQRSRVSIVLGMLWRDKFATFAVLFLILVILCALFGPALIGEAATKQNLRGRNAPPFSLQPSLRYAHSARYVRELAARRGFGVLREIEAAVREDRREAVPGIYFYLGPAAR